MEIMTVEELKAEMHVVHLAVDQIASRVDGIEDALQSYVKQAEVTQASVRTDMSEIVKSLEAIRAHFEAAIHTPPAAK